MSDRLPEWITPVTLAEAEKQLAGTVALADMARLAPLLGDRQGSVEVGLRFGVDEAGIRFVSGTIRGQLVVSCQRCLGELRLPVDIRMRLGIVADAEAGERLPGRYEPLVAGKDPVRVSDLVEDELLLFLPAVPMHREEEHCQPPRAVESDTDESVEENPFAVLAKLKRNP